jgi:hypothetical protein
MQLVAQPPVEEEEEEVEQPPARPQPFGIFQFGSKKVRRVYTCCFVSTGSSPRGTVQQWNVATQQSCDEQYCLLLL